MTEDKGKQVQGSAHQCMWFRTTCAVWLMLVSLQGVAQQAADPVEQARSEKQPLARVEKLTAIIQAQPSSQAYYYRGWAYCDAGNYTLALQDFKLGAASRGTINTASMYAGMSYVHYQQGQYDAAVDYATQAIKLAANYPFAYRYRALAYQKLGQLLQAENDVNTAIAQQPSDGFGYYVRAGIRIEKQNLAGALADIDTGLKSYPSDAYYLQRKLVILEKMGSHDEVLALAPRVTAFSGDDPMGYNYLGATFHNQQEYAIAIKYYTDAIDGFRARMLKDIAYRRKHIKDLYSAYINRGNAHRSNVDPNPTHTGNLQQTNNLALNDYTLATELLPDSFMAYRELGYLHTYAKNYHEAVNAFEKCFLLNPMHPYGWVNLGFCYAQQKNDDAAIEVYNRALRIPKVDGMGLLYNNRGSSFLDKGELEKAKADFEAAIRADPGVPMSYISLGEYHVRIADCKTATAWFDKALAMPSLDERELWTAHFQRGLCHRTLGELDKAIADLTAAIQADPEQADAYEELADTYFFSKEYCKAYRNYQQAQKQTERMYPRKGEDISLAVNRIQGLTGNAPCK